MNHKDSALHDLKNLANTLSLYLDAAVMPEAENAPALVEQARAAAHLLSNRLVLLLLDGRLAEGLQARASYILLEDFLADLQCSVVLSPRRSFELRCDTPEATVRIDAYLVRQALEAALHNADRFSSPENPLVVEAHCAAGWLRFTVTNPVDLEGRGESGFGLSLAKAIAEAHTAHGTEGSATLAIQDGLATFTLRLPQ
jgi:signal transduction histidine kinase